MAWATAKDKMIMGPRHREELGSLEFPRRHYDHHPRRNGACDPGDRIEMKVNVQDSVKKEVRMELGYSH